MTSCSLDPRRQDLNRGVCPCVHRSIYLQGDMRSNADSRHRHSGSVDRNILRAETDRIQYQPADPFASGNTSRDCGERCHSQAVEGVHAKLRPGYNRQDGIYRRYERSGRRHHLHYVSDDVCSCRCFLRAVPQARPIANSV